MIVQKQICDQLISETEQSLQRMGLDLYEIMQRALAAVEKWKRYYGPFQEVWNHASNREELTAFLLTGPDPSPEEMETVLTLIRTVPYLLRSSLQDAAKHRRNADLCWIAIPAKPHLVSESHPRRQRWQELQLWSPEN